MFDRLAKTWTSPGGLVYGPDKNYGNRVKHVLRHFTPDPSDPNHSVFSFPKNQLIETMDEAWGKRVLVEDIPGRPTVAFVADMARVVGTAGQQKIRVVVFRNTTKVVTAYPVP